LSAHELEGTKKTLKTEVVELAAMKDTPGFDQLPGPAVQLETKSNSQIFYISPLSLPWLLLVNSGMNFQIKMQQYK